MFLNHLKGDRSWDNPANATIKLRLTYEDKAAIRKRAEWAGVTMSEFLQLILIVLAFSFVVEVLIAAALALGVRDAKKPFHDGIKKAGPNP